MYMYYRLYRICYNFVQGTSMYSICYIYVTYMLHVFSYVAYLTSILCCVNIRPNLTCQGFSGLRFQLPWAGRESRQNRYKRISFSAQIVSKSQIVPILQRREMKSPFFPFFSLMLFFPCHDCLRGIALTARPARIFNLT